MTTTVKAPYLTGSEKFLGKQPKKGVVVKYGNLTLGQIEAGINIIGGEEAFRLLLQGKLAVSAPPHLWQEKDGVIYFSVTSDGATGPEWIERLEKKGFRIGDYAKSILCSPDFKPTSGVTTEIAVLKGMLFEDNDRTTEKIRAEADRRNLTKPNTEVACLIREMFTDEEIEAMGLWSIVAMHEPIKDSDGDPGLLGVGRYDDGRWLGARCGKPGCSWGRGGGFAFVAPQVAS